MSLQLRQDFSTGFWEVFDTQKSVVLKTFKSYNQAYFYKLKLLSLVNA